MSVSVKMDDAAMRRLVAEVKRKIEDADRRFRSLHAGEPVEKIEPQVQRWFQRVGVDLQPGQVKDYADAVSGDAPFEWKVS